MMTIMANRFLYLARHGDAPGEGELSPTGQQQAWLLGQRLRDVPLAAIHHSPLPRAAHTARLVGESLPGVPLADSAEVGDYIPPVPDPQALPEAYARFLGGVTADDYAYGAKQAAAALARHALPTDVETHELIITHTFLIAWFVRHALDAPHWRWLGLNAGNCALTTILYRPNRTPLLLTFNDMAHLPPALRWTGFPPELHV